jgi:hypothetical protein
MESIAPAKKTNLYIYVEAEPIATLESALAIIRRLGIELRALRMEGGSNQMIVRLCLSGVGEGEIALCCQRLQNVIGISGVREHPRAPDKPG